MRYHIMVTGLMLAHSKLWCLNNRRVSFVLESETMAQKRAVVPLVRIQSVSHKLPTLSMRAAVNG